VRIAAARILQIKHFATVASFIPGLGEFEVLPSRDWGDAGKVESGIKSVLFDLGLKAHKRIIAPTRASPGSRCWGSTY
jgi:hypothetical protein